MNPVKRMREEKGWSQAECADCAGISQQHWSYLENRPEILNILYAGMASLAKGLRTNYVGLLVERRKDAVAVEEM